MEDITVGFIGFGLIGGSIARGLRKIHPSYTITAYNYYDSPNPKLEQAVQEETLNYIVNSLDELSCCDILFLCAPVLENINYLKQLKSIVKPSCIITDVGSVKGSIIEAAHSLGLDSQFVGGHPMAGSEKTGYASSSAYLLENAYYILTPTKATPTDMMQTLQQLVEDIGAIPVILDNKEHDDIVAAISHVPHIIASSLVNLVREHDTENKMLSLAAGGFKDITRIASSSPVMWQNICLTNRDSILKFLERYQEQLARFTDSIRKEKEDSIIQSFETAKDYRDSIPKSNVNMPSRIFEIYLDIIDEAGAIAIIATLLASNAVSIKNIGIIHNREFEEGVLRIEFYDQNALDKSIAILNRYHYHIYERN